MVERRRLDLRCVADGARCHSVGPLSLQQHLSRPKQGIFRLQLPTSLHVYLTPLYSGAIVETVALLYKLYSNVTPQAFVERLGQWRKQRCVPIWFLSRGPPAMSRVIAS